jgi:glycerophosphoryl diester phosphodiesterase
MKTYNSKIIAHRGASFDAPENTIHAINLAWKQNISKVEIDIHMTKDNRIVVIHDSNTAKIAIKNLTVKKELFATLRTLDIGSWKHKKWRGTKIPSIEEILATLPDFGTLIIEIKCGLEVIPYLTKAIEEIPSHQIEFISFDYEIISCLKKKLPQYKALWLLDLDYTLETNNNCLSLDTYLKKTVDAKLDGLNLWAGKTANKSYIEKIKQQHLLVYIWSTNSVNTAAYFLDLNVDAITTDRPYWLLQKLEEKEND